MFQETNLDFINTANIDFIHEQVVGKCISKHVLESPLVNI